MRLGRVFGCAALVLTVSALGLAQPRAAKRRPAQERTERVDKGEEKTPSATDKSAEASERPAKPDDADKRGASEAAASEPETPSSGDLGAEPPKASAAPGESKLSPLTPEANEFPSGAPKPAPEEFDRLLGQIAALRTRVAALTRTMFASKLRVSIEARAEAANIASLAVTLDDGIAYSANDRAVFSDERTVYEHAVAPGYHVLGINVERYATANQQYRTWQSSRFSVLVPEGKLTRVSVVLDDDSEMAEDFPSSQDGEYDLRVRLRAEVED